MGKLKKLTTQTINNNMFKSFAPAIALFAIGAYASDEEKPSAAGVFYTKDTYKYGRFIANMKASNAKGTGSAFFLYNLEDFDEDQDVFENWNSMTIVPSISPLFYTKMSK